MNDICCWLFSFKFGSFLRVFIGIWWYHFMYAHYMYCNACTAHCVRYSTLMHTCAEYLMLLTILDKCVVICRLLFASVNLYRVPLTVPLPSPCHPIYNLFLVRIRTENFNNPDDFNRVQNVVRIYICSNDRASCLQTRILFFPFCGIEFLALQSYCIYLSGVTCQHPRWLKDQLMPRRMEFGSVNEFAGKSITFPWREVRSNVTL